MRYVKLSIDPTTNLFSGQLLPQFAKFSKKGTIDLGRHHKEVYAFLDAEAASILRSDTDVINLARNFNKTVDEAIRLGFCPENPQTVAYLACSIACHAAFIESNQERVKL